MPRIALRLQRCIGVVGFAFAVPTVARAEEPPIDLDAIGSVRVGVGHSTLLRARILSLSFEDQIRVHRLSDTVGITAIFGVDAQRPLDFDSPRLGFLATGLGAGLLIHQPPGPALTLGLTGAPLWQSKDDSTHLAGFGAALRVEGYPFYQTLIEAVHCRRGVIATYVLSGLHVWALGRRDFIGLGGESWAMGLGFDLGRNAILPVLGAVLPAACGK